MIESNQNSDSQSEEKAFLTVGEAAEHLGVSSWTLRNWDKNGRLTPHRNPKNGYRLYRRDQLEAILTSGSAHLLPDGDWADLGGAEHCVQFYESQEALMRAVAEFIAPAFDSGNGALVIATEEHRRGIRERLEARGVNLAQLESQGLYCALDAAETLAKFMEGDMPDPVRFGAVIGPLMQRLAGKDHSPRAFGEMVALLWAEGKKAAAISLEELWNTLADTCAFSLLCGYPMAHFVGEGGDRYMEAICSHHGRVRPAESYADLESPAERLQAILLLQRKAAALEAEVAQRKEAERALVERELEVSDFLQNAVEGIHQVGPDGIILWANRAELELLGYQPEEYVGHHVAEFHIDREVIDEILQKLSRGETLFNQLCRLRCKDGTMRHVLIHSNARFVDGELKYTRCFTRDITEQVRSGARLAAIVESSDDAIVSKSLNGIIRSWNKSAEALFGYTEEEAIGKHITLIIPPDRFDEERDILAKISRGEHVKHFETIRRHKDGRPLEVSISVSPVRDGAGKVIGVSKIARDISERSRIERELRQSRAAADQANRSKDQFIAVLSHELRTPLTPVLLAIESMETEPNLSARTREDLAMIRRNIALETRLIDDLLDLSRVVSGKMALHMQDWSLHTLIGNVMEMVRTDAIQKQITFTLSLHARHDQVRADSARLHQVLWNLIKNAVKFTPSGGSIQVRTRNDADRIILEVEDTGVGIDPALMDKIFEPFNQGEKGTTRQFGGLGLGLAISRAIVAMHKGRITVQSAGKGCGSCFTLELAAEPARAGGRRPALPPASEQNAPALRILLVDDNADTLGALKRLLTTCGHAVTPCGTVNAAIAKLDTEDFDLLVSDIGLPDGSGLDLMNYARQHRPQMRGIALTGYGMEEDIQRCDRAGFSAHMTKPVDFVRLQEMIMQWTPVRPSGAILTEAAGRSPAHSQPDR